MIKSCKHWYDTGADETNVFDYDGYNRLIRKTHYYDIKNSPGKIAEYKYNEKGLLEAEVRGREVLQTYVYNDNNQLIEEKSSSIVNRYEYNSCGQVIAINEYDGDGITLRRRYLYEYDCNGNLSKSTTCTGDGLALGVEHGLTNTMNMGTL